MSEWKPIESAPKMVTDSCGCVYCDIKLPVIVVNDIRQHPMALHRLAPCALPHPPIGE